MIVWFWSQRTFCFSLAFCYLLVFTCIAFFLHDALFEFWMVLFDVMSRDPWVYQVFPFSSSSLIFTFFLPRSPFSCALFYFVNCCSLCYSCCYSVLPNRASHLLLLTLSSGVFFNCTPDIKTMPNYQKKAAAGYISWCDPVEAVSRFFRQFEQIISDSWLTWSSVLLCAWGKIGLLYISMSVQVFELQVHSLPAAVVWVVRFVYSHAKMWSENKLLQQIAHPVCKVLLSVRCRRKLSAAAYSQPLHSHFQVYLELSGSVFPVLLVGLEILQISLN